MIIEDKGPLPVVEGGRVVGMLTDRDIISRLVAEGQDPQSVNVKDIHTEDLVTIGPDQDAEEARQLMARHHLVDRNSGLWSTKPTGGVGVPPLDGLGRLVVQSDVAEKLAAEVAGRTEDASGDDVALDLAEPELDLIQPAGVGGREVEMEVLMKTQELLHALALVGRKVVQDDVDLLLGGPAAHYRA